MANEMRLRQNFLGGLLVADLPAAGTVLESISLSAVPVVNGTSHLPIVLDPDGVYGDPEIAWVISHANGAETATIARAQEGTEAREHKRDTPWLHGQTIADFALPAPTSVIAAYTMTGADLVVIANGTFTVTLPPTVVPGRRYSVKNVGVGTITVAPHSGGLIDGLPNFSLPGQYDAIDVVRDGNNWWLL